VPPLRAMTDSRPRARRTWTAALVAVFAVAVAWTGAAGPGARATFEPPPDFNGRRWAVVRDAAEAFRAWSAAGVHGRRLVVFSGRWATVTPDTLPGAGTQPVPAGAQVDETGLPTDLVDRDTALLAAARSGIAREVIAVMPPAAYAARREVASRDKAARLGEGWHDHPYHGFPRRFALATALPPIDEPALVLIEPSWFGTPGALDPRAVLRRAGSKADLGLLALEDPVASEAQVLAAQGYAEELQALPVSVKEETP